MTDAAVLTALEKAYTHFDASKGARITTYLSTLVHNEIVDELARESKAAARQEDIDDIKAVVRSYSEELSPEAKEELIRRLRTAITKLSPSDQVILDFYLEDKRSYIARSAETLHISENYVSLRRLRIFKQLPRLMEMTREQYLLYSESFDSIVLADGPTVRSESRRPHLRTWKADGGRTFRPNPILPSLDPDVMARRMLELA